MNTTPPLDAGGRLRAALASPTPSARLQAAMSAGTHPRPEYVEPLIERCASEPDLNVRETLTWALMRHPSSITVPLLIDETRSATTQARIQALHTLSKIGNPAGWAAITPEVMNDADDRVARTAWRVAVVLVPDGSEHELADKLVAQLGRGAHDIRLSLSRALIALGDSAVALLENVAEQGTERERVHAIATQRLRDVPDDGFDAALMDAELTVMLSDTAEPGSATGPDSGAEPDAENDVDLEPDPGPSAGDR